MSARFRKERETLGYSRPELAEKLDVTSDTVKNWEAGRSLPDAHRLALFYELGADVMFIITGMESKVSFVEQEVPSNYFQGERILTPAQKAAGKIKTMDLTESDADLLLSLARRLSPPA
ncbi:MAG: helix-turn-helix domain-containing protein [Rhodocyclaceae bacterium]|nr:helix-turn-helix domain-containing protein [Rhodocyclaceae bacterium]